MLQSTRSVNTALDTGTTRQSPEAAWPEGVAPRFRPLALVAEGTSARVWKVHDSQTNSLCALKMLSPHWRDHAAARSMFENEARIGQRVAGKYVVRTVDARLDGANPYLAQEWLAGNTLEVKLARETRLFNAAALWIARQTVQGMLELAGEGVAHGDIKPANIFLLANGQVKLIDLGFARPLHEDGVSASRGALTGTADYMAPESLSTERHNPIARDVYSLGVTLFRMLTGSLPFQAASIAQVMRLHRESRPPALRRRCPDASRELADLVQRMLAKQPIRRPQNLNDLLHALVSLELGALPTLAAA